MITLLTIGQTPRNDLILPFENAQFQQKLNLVGALDELTEKEIKHLEYQEEDNPLFVRTRYGSTNINHDCIEKELQRLIDHYENKSKAIVILCMGEFACHSKKVPIVQPIKEIKKKMMTVTKKERVLIFIPVAEQYEKAVKKWNEMEAETIIQTVSPGTEKTFEQMRKMIEQYQPDIVLLDCYGYATEFPEKLKQISGCTVYGPQQLVIDKLKEIV